MLIKRASDFSYADVTPKEMYKNRRDFLRGVVAAGAGLAGWTKAAASPGIPTGSVPVKLNGIVKSPYSTSEAVTPKASVTTYNNYYEFGASPPYDNAYKNSKNFNTSPWSVSIEGEVAKPRTLTMDEIMRLAPLEERIYRHRCVETWSIIVPWIGYSLKTIVNLVQPTAKAKYVAFQSYYDPKQMPLGSEAGIEFPYIGGLRLDEAMNPLALLCVGMYDETLPNQDGAPVRLVLPWKYGFKSIKAIVKIRFVTNQPRTTWNIAAPSYYGFYSNVNPSVGQPWSQRTEHRLGGGLFTRPIATQMFNGYGDQVASMYANMDLRKYY